MVALRSSQLFPGRAPKINLAHPALIGGAGRLVAVANGDSTMHDLLTNQRNILPQSTIAGEFTAGMGPTVHPTGGAPSTGCEFPVLIPGETWTTYTLGVIFSPRTFTIGQGLVNANGASGSAYKISTTSGSALVLDEANVAVLTFPPPIKGHIYFVACSVSKNAVGPGQSKSQGICVDLTTGQVSFQAASTGSVPGLGSIYSLATYTSTGGADQGRVAAGMISTKFLTQAQLWDWGVNDPWGLWYDPSSQPLNFLSVANNAPPPNTNSLALAVNDAVETFAGHIQNIAVGTNNLILAANDAVETFAGTISLGSLMDTHDGDTYVPAYLADRWNKAREKYNPKKPDEQTDAGPRYLTKPKKVKIRRLKPRKTVMVRRLKAPA